MPLIKELRLAFRMLSKSPGFWALALVTLALGIGISTVLFSVTESVLWRPLRFPDSHRLVWVSEQNLKRPSEEGAAGPNFRDWRDRARSFQRLAAFGWGESHNLAGTGFAERVRVFPVSAGFFETLRVQPALGRTFLSEEEQSGKTPVVILSNEFWKRNFASVRTALGAQVKIDGNRFTVVGVLPAKFRLEVIEDPDIYVPLNLDSQQTARADKTLAAIGRLNPGVTIEQANVEMAGLAKRLAADYPDANGNWGAKVENFRDAFTSYSRGSLLLFLGFAGFVLLIACANVAGLLLVRFIGRRKEFALRLALGAPKTALLRQAIAETACVALPGGLAGALMAAWGLEAIRKLMPPDELVRASNISMDLSALGFVLAISLATTFLFALAPALMASKLDADATLRDWGKSVSAGRGTRRKVHLLVAVEVMLSFVLLFGAGLFTSSYFRLQRVRLGFNPQGVLSMRISPGTKSLSNPAATLAFYREMLRKTASIGGIEQAALSSGPPLIGTPQIYFASADAPRPAHGEEPRSLVRVISPEYFRLLSIPLLTGRAFTEQDSESAPRVAIVNENLAHSIFGAENPVGKELVILQGRVPAGTVRIVGLASNTKEVGLDEVVFNDIYLPFAQSPEAAMYLLAKTPARPQAVIATVRRQLQSLDPEGALYGLGTMEASLNESLQGTRFNLALVAVFASLAVLLASVGIYGAIALSVTQRTPEFGLRMALGAQPGAILRLTLSQAARLTLSGAVCGLAIALALGEMLKSTLYLAPGKHVGLIYGVSVHDPASLAAAALLMLGLAALAGLVPANRAANVDPLAALRHE